VRRPLLATGAVMLVLAPGVLLLRGQSATEHPHGDLKIDCGECHGPDRWVPLQKQMTFRHQTTGYALESAHAKASCRSCHRSLVFNHVGTACMDCHQDGHRGELGSACESCHTPSTWTNQGDMFRVHNRTRFPLLAVHARLDCTSCHRNQRPSQYAATPAECGGCHLETFAQTTSPSHVQVNFSRRCEDCHAVTATSWHDARFSHTERFPLRGGHSGLTCSRCHSSGVYIGLPAACVSCHQKDYAAAANPKHVPGRFSTTCEDCHTINGWRPAKFDHSTTTFPLTGAHNAVDCARCHTGGRFTGTPKQCAACHQPDYDRTTNPNHRASGFPTECETCHSTSAWRPANFDHSRTRFPLTGAHKRAECTACHAGGNYTGTPRACSACHQKDYDRTTDPDHRASGFPTECETCHGTAAWRPSTFDHNRTQFPLTGAHTRLDCTRCHAGGRFAGTPKQCVGCHQADYDRSADPNHRAAALGTQCENCHATKAWRPASFVDHDTRSFPIYSGKHRGVWSRCSQCHVSAGNYRVFECTTCHLKPVTDPIHAAVGGYVYLSTACYGCHPKGQRP